MLMKILNMFTSLIRTQKKKKISRIAVYTIYKKYDMIYTHIPIKPFQYSARMPQLKNTAINLGYDNIGVPRNKEVKQTDIGLTRPIECNRFLLPNADNLYSFAF